MSGARPVLVCVAVLAACRNDGPSSLLDVSTPASTPLPPEPAVVRLSTSARGADRVALTLVAPDLGLAQPVADLAFPWACLSTIGPDGVFRTTCTPDVWHPILEVSVEARDLVVAVRAASDAGTVRRVALPEGGTVRFEEGDTSLRSIDPSFCSDDAPVRDIDVTLRAREGFVYLDVPGATSPFVVAKRKGPRGTCRTLVEEGVSMRLTCDEGAIDCSFGTTDKAVHFDCTKPGLYSGMVLVPCGARARFPKAPLGM